MATDDFNLQVADSVAFSPFTILLDNLRTMSLVRDLQISRQRAANVCMVPPLSCFQAASLNRRTATGVIHFGNLHQ